MSWVFNRTRFVLGGLLVLHVLWIATHMYLVKNNHLNQWKLGGYGMYTHPTPRFRLNAHVEGFDDQQQWRNKPNFAVANWNFVMPCRPLSAENIAGFYQDNPNAIGKKTYLLVTIKSFKRYPIEAKYVPKIDVEITWSDATTFVWQGEVCGELSEGRGQWSL